MKMREERAARRERMGTATLNVQEAEKSGKLVAEMKNVSFVWPDGYKVFEDANVIIQRGEKIGLIGDNGAGKTTFLRVLLGELAPTSGTVRLGTGLQIAYFDQLRRLAGRREERDGQRGRRQRQSDHQRRTASRGELSSGFSL